MTQERKKEIKKAVKKATRGNPNDLLNILKTIDIQEEIKYIGKLADKAMCVGDINAPLETKLDEVAQRCVEKGNYALYLKTIMQLSSEDSSKSQYFEDKVEEIENSLGVKKKLKDMELKYPPREDELEEVASNLGIVYYGFKKLQEIKEQKKLPQLDEVLNEVFSDVLENLGNIVSGNKCNCEREKELELKEQILSIESCQNIIDLLIPDRVTLIKEMEEVDRICDSAEENFCQKNLSRLLWAIKNEPNGIVLLSNTINSMRKLFVEYKGSVKANKETLEVYIKAFEDFISTFSALMIEQFTKTETLSALYEKIVKEKLSTIINTKKAYKKDGGETVGLDLQIDSVRSIFNRMSEVKQAAISLAKEKKDEFLKILEIKEK